VPRETLANAQEAIQEVNRTFSDFLSSGDPAGLARCYAKEAVLMPPNQDLIYGRNNIEGFWRGLMTAGIKSIRLESQLVEQHGDVVCEIGRYTVFIQRNEAVDEGKYLVLWLQESGEWKLFRDIWNSSRPIATP